MPQFSFHERLGSGQFGEVWRTTDHALGATRAVKVIRPSRLSNAGNSFTEAQTLQRLQHPHVVQVYDAGQFNDGRIYISMEYLANGSAADISRGGPTPLTRSVKLIQESLYGLEYIHSQGYVHRDIKPANIMIGDSGEAKISDFGLATRTNDTGDAGGYGYTAHLAPEVITDGLTNRLTDIYAVGVTLYRLINGDYVLSYPDDASEMHELIVSGKFPPRNGYLPFVPKRLSRIINRSMSVDPSKRFRSCSDFRHALESLTVKYDWDVNQFQSGRVWTGTSPSMCYSVKVSHSDGLWNIETTRGKIGKQHRRVMPNCLSGLNQKDAETKEREILQSITTK